MTKEIDHKSVEMKDINLVIAKIENAAHDSLEDITLASYQALAIALLAREVCALREMFDISRPGPGAVIEVHIDD